MREGATYRSASPVDHECKRAAYIDDLMRQTEAAYVLDLPGGMTDEQVDKLSGTCRKLKPTSNLQLRTSPLATRSERHNYIMKVPQLLNWHSSLLQSEGHQPPETASSS